MFRVGLGWFGVFRVVLGCVSLGGLGCCSVGVFWGWFGFGVFGVGSGCFRVGLGCFRVAGLGCFRVGWFGVF